MGDEQRRKGSLKESRMPSRLRRGDFDGKIAGLYDLEETIGEGHFAVVKLAKHVFTGEKVAVKVIDKTKLDDVSKSHLFQEVRCMKLVQHPNVVRLYEVIDTQTKLYLILELGDGGDMYDYIMKHDQGLDEKKARRYFRQIVEAISYCHKLHVVHRDLKPENVVFFKKVEMVKLTDFGFSNMFNPGRKLETSCGSLAYSAPEILLGDSYDAPAVDIWSLGVILYMLVCGTPPFQEANDSETLTMIMDCKYNFPLHVSESCKHLCTQDVSFRFMALGHCVYMTMGQQLHPNGGLISLMLKREPSHRANLLEIEEHPWLKEDADIVPHFHMPLISRELLSEEDHLHVIEKMVEGCIAPKDEILQSLEKDMYNHITATYYLLAERRLKKHRQEQVNQAAMSHVRKNSAPSGPGKPHLEPLALSPRKQREIKKTKTAPITQSISQMLAIPESPNKEDAGGFEPRPDYFKSLTMSQTLDRRSKHKTRVSHAEPSSAGALAVRPRFGHLDLSPSPNRELPTVQEPVTPIPAQTKKSKRPFNKIAILSSFFEQKIAALSGNGKGQRWRLPGFGKKKTSIMSKEAESADDRKHGQKQKGLMMSLLSPQGIHPTPSTSRGSPVHGKGRKCSLIKEESVEEGEEGDEEEDMDMELGLENFRLSKSADNLDTDEPNASRNATSPLREKDPIILKRPLLSVASSPQLLNQICEENESEEEDDLVPLRLHSARMLTQRNSLASPEVIRKYEARQKRRGTGSRGTSCSSSDASDTDDTEGRSRKDKLKHKFAHRRDSSDHSSDTDGGPSGPGGGGFGKGLGGGGGGGNGPSKDRDDKGGGGGKKEGKGGSPKSGRSHHSRSKQNNLSLNVCSELIPRSMRGRTSDINVNSGVSNLSLVSLSSKSSLKYVLEKDENVSDSDAEDNGDNENDANAENCAVKDSHVEMLNHRNNMKRRDGDGKAFSSLIERKHVDKKHSISSICSHDCDLVTGKKTHKSIKTDINSNLYSKPACKGPAMKVETKCCSLV